jgi:cysteine-rich repeat protein
VATALGALMVAAVAVVALRGPAVALTKKEVGCRDRASRIARGALGTALYVRVNCVRRTVFGNFDPTIDCTADPAELGGDGTGDLYADRRLRQLAFSSERAGSVLARVCLNRTDPSQDILPSDVALDDACNPPSDDWLEVGACLVDRGMEAALVMMQGLDLPGPGPLSAPAIECIDYVHRHVRRTVGGQARFRSICYKLDDLAADGGGAYNCGATIMPPGTIETVGLATVDKRMNQFFPRLDRALRQRCDIPLAELGWPVMIPDVTGGRFEDRITLFDVSDRLNDLVQETVNLITFGETGPEGTLDAAQAGGFCGDGVVDAGEQCDDGNNLSCDGCDRDCTLPTCGNGSVCDNEECDDGNNVSGDGCSATCISEICGNNVTNPGWDEECDDAGFSVTCDDDCSFAICGDQLVNPVAGETCDEGTGLPDNLALNTPTCDSDCSAPACPDGHWNPFNTNAPAPPGGEECDDGGNSLACDADCTLASCGDGFTNPVRGEQCDDSNFSDTDDCPSSSTVPGSFCQNAFCGDGFVCAGMGCSSPEFCDDGDGTPGSSESATCDNDCTAVACGDSNVNASAGEQCDTGAAVGNNRPCTGGCQNALCGDGLVCSHGTCTTGPGAGPELCDDANANNNDMCRNDCAAATCGDSVVCSDAGCTTGPLGGPEVCDTGGNSPTCDSDCSAAGCGDGFHNAAAGEQCDGGGETAGCNADCTLNACGDGKVNVTAGENCDDGNGVNTDACRNDCQPAVCGDSVVCSGAGCTTGPGFGVEQCDSGGESINCDTDCSLAFCGDGQTNVTRGEQCDDAGESAACNANCTLSVCGDGIVNATDGENCDDGVNNGSGEGFCVVGCTGVQTCGNGVTEGTEFCDDGASNGTSGLCNLTCTGIEP